MTRDDVQLEAYEAWQKANSIGTIIGGTGVGKTLIGIWACREEIANSPINGLVREPKRILWLTNSIRLKEVGTPEDFNKWHLGGILPTITFETYQTAYKWKDTEWDLIVADEADFALTPQYSLVFENNKYSKLLLLTATSTPEKTAVYLDQLAPICYSFTTQQAQQANILNDTQLVFVHFNLSYEKTIEVKKGFKQSEQGMYEWLQKMVIEKWIILSDLQNDPSATKQELAIANRQFQFFIGKRKEFLYNMPSSAKIARQFAKSNIEDGHKVISFSKRTEQAEKIAKHTYHSKNKKGSTVIEDFNSGKIKGFGVVDAINRGENLVGLDTIILESYDSSTTVFQQRHGRGMRLDVEDILKVYILLPYYSKNGKQTATQAVTWAYEMVKEFDISQAQHLRL